MGDFSKVTNRLQDDIRLSFDALSKRMLVLWPWFYRTRRSWFHELTKETDQDFIKYDFRSSHNY